RPVAQPQPSTQEDATAGSAAVADRDSSLSSSPRLIKRRKKRVSSTSLLLASTKRLPPTDCDETISEFSNFMEETLTREDTTFQCFNIETDRLDSIWHTQLSRSPFQKLWKVVKDATVERGFSSKKEVMVTTMSDKCLIVLRVIGDHVRQVGGLDKIEVTKKMLSAVASSRQRYQHHVDEQKAAKEEAERGKKRKAALDEAILVNPFDCKVTWASFLETLRETLFSVRWSHENVLLLIE
ncbi:hypothetical protein BaRGS_00003747, partial [Batillaria attramentaria]